MRAKEAEAAGDEAFELEDDGAEIEVCAMEFNDAAECIKDGANVFLGVWEVEKLTVCGLSILNSVLACISRSFSKTIGNRRVCEVCIGCSVLYAVSTVLIQDIFAQGFKIKRWNEALPGVVIDCAWRYCRTDWWRATSHMGRWFCD